MTCGKEKKHYMKAAFDYGRSNDQLFNAVFFEEFLPDGDPFFVYVNAVSLD
jgi:hypothetical protein